MSQMVGLIIRFESKEHMDQWILERQDYENPDLQARPMDSSDPKELFVLNTGRDGDQ
tara:strand:- start:1006 stop:1176 length:171 start_codon:yes stop_codon:yes gene_type:complete